MKKLVIISVIAIAAVRAVLLAELPISRITLRAVDETGTAISNAKVRISFDEPNPHWGGAGVLNVTGVTDENGAFSGQGHSGDRMGGLIQKQGYYTSVSTSVKFDRVNSGKWQPWDPTIDVILKQIVNPVPMYAKRVNMSVPAMNAPVGYDLEIGDWVSPYGKGTSSDLVFTARLDRREERDFDYRLTVSFAKSGDGIQSFVGETYSALKSPRVAPENGYQSQWMQMRSRRPGEAERWSRDETRNYFIRVRTVVDQQGKVVSCLYGKIYGDFMNFTYYLNPTPNDRNVEFDPKRNLFTNLKPDECVTAP